MSSNDQQHKSEKSFIEDNKHVAVSSKDQQHESNKSASEYNEYEYDSERYA